MRQKKQYLFGVSSLDIFGVLNGVRVDVSTFLEWDQES